jgi:hypothetical protein
VSDQPTPEAVEAVAAILREQGVDSLHGWRCGYPDRYGPCDCLAELAADTLTELRDAIHRDGDDADAIRETLGLRLECAGVLPGRGDHGETLHPHRIRTEWQEVSR